ncbi:MAG: zinc ribbon domain-containing protein [Cyanobacteria bacterium P01_A01_bin.40]
MPSCPKCKQPVDPQIIICPQCNNPLKAFGHPGITLYQSEDNSSLCDRCTYHLDDTCNFPQRPYAKSCTLFHDADQPLVEEEVQPLSQLGWRGFKNWLYRYRGLIAIAGLIIFSVALALNSQ